MKQTLSECSTPHEQVEYLCNRWFDNATTYAKNETAIDHLHGVWSALMIYDSDPATRKMVDEYADKCYARRDELRADV